MQPFLFYTQQRQQPQISILFKCKKSDGYCLMSHPYELRYPGYAKDEPLAQSVRRLRVVSENRVFCIVDIITSNGKCVLHSEYNH